MALTAILQSTRLFDSVLVANIRVYVPNVCFDFIKDTQKYSALSDSTVWKKNISVYIINKRFFLVNCRNFGFA